MESSLNTQGKKKKEKAKKKKTIEPEHYQVFGKDFS